jgi:hypothetical protein
VYRAIEKLACLGNGYRILNLDEHQKLLVSVPIELNTDHSDVLSCAKVSNGVMWWNDTGLLGQTACADENLTVF